MTKVSTSTQPLFGHVTLHVPLQRAGRIREDTKHGCEATIKSDDNCHFYHDYTRFLCRIVFCTHSDCTLNNYTHLRLVFNDMFYKCLQFNTV